MPTYDYRCVRCRTQFEVRHGLAAPAPVCPQCGGEVRRLIRTAPAVHGHMARGRELAVRSLEPRRAGHGPDCPCCH